jgi:hypothetical protein
MSQILKRFILIIAVAAMTWTSSAFSLLGPFDAWQTPFLGYNPLNGDLGGPKLLGEEWRWGISDITYAFDQSFIDWFGTNGMKAVDDAFAAYNRELTNLSAMTASDLLAKPAQTRRVNLTAASLSLIDVKTEMMGLIAEQLGLATADRWVWALRARTLPAPGVTNWLVVPFNYDPFTLKPSSYINGIRYTYHIESFPGATFTGIDFEDAVESLVDQTQLPYAGAVSSLISPSPFTFTDFYGEYFPSLTRDDIGGLKYIYQRENVNREDVPTNTFQIVVDPAVQFIQGIDAYSFFTNAAFGSASNLLAQFPNLVILSTNSIGITNIVATNIFVTNFTSSTLITDRTSLTIISNLDLFTFSEASRTNPPNTMRALYPGLIITSTNSVPVFTQIPILTLTNLPWSSPGDPPTVVTNFVTQIIANFTYTFANVITNYASAVTDLQTQDVLRAPWSTPTELFFMTNVTVSRVAIPSGGFYILDRATNANLIAYSLTDTNGVPLLRTTNYVTRTNIVFFDPNTLRTIATANVFTNVTYAAYPVFLNGSLGSFMVTNVVTNIFGFSQYTFGNVLFFPPANGNTSQTLQISSLLNGTFTSTSTAIPSDFPIGTVLILDTNQFQLIRDAAGNPIRTETYGFATNILINFTNAATGDFILEQVIRQTNSTFFAVHAVQLVAANGLALRPGVNMIHFRRMPLLDPFDGGVSLYTNIFTNIVQTGGLRTTNVYRRVAGADLLISAADIGVNTGPLPVAVARSVGWPGTPTAGPGLIQPGQVITFNKLLPSWFNQGPGFNTEETASFTGAFGSFDGRTITPIVYPEPLLGPANTNLLKQLEDMALGRTPRP